MLGAAPEAHGRPREDRADPQPPSGRKRQGLGVMGHHIVLNV